MHNNWVLAMTLLACGMVGCSLDSAPEHGNPCPDGAKIQYLVKDGSRCSNPDECKCTQPQDCPGYADSFDSGVCPVDIPVCHQTSDDNYYCMAACPSGLAACDGECILGNLDAMHCGAKGDCYSSDDTSPHYKGKECQPNESCVNSECVRTGSCDNGIWCDGRCIIPENDKQYCGASGNCNNSNASSQDYVGQNCTELLGENSECRARQCVCENGFAVIDGKCGRPGSNESCGKDSNGTDIICGEHSTCIDKACVCAEGFVEVDGICVDPSSNDYCGATEGHAGHKCSDGFQCTDGQCTCSDGYAKCGDRCVDGNKDTSHCGARGLCNSNDKDNNYQGIQCNDGEICDSGICRKQSGNCNTPGVCPSICSNDVSHCGIDCTDCSDENAEEVDCEHGACVVYSCVKGYHLSENKDRCIKNQDHACGRVDSEKVVDCTIANGIRKCGESGTCEFVSCNEDAHEHTDDLGKTCEDDTAENCASHGAQCHNIDEEPEGMTCLNKTCYVQECTKLTNSLSCPQENTVCRQTSNDIYNCQLISGKENPCFIDGSGAPIDCKNDLYDGRGLTVECIYAPELADSRWYPTGWTCGCLNSDQKLHVKKNSKGNNTYTCNGNTN